MIKSSARIFCTIGLLALCSGIVMAQPSHSVWSYKPIWLIDGQTGISYKPIEGKAATSWTEKTRDGYFRAIAVVSSGQQQYEFTLVSIGNSDDSTITGIWDIRRDGILVCEGCVGKAYGLRAPVGDYFKIYIGDANGYAERWHYSGYITSRFDFGK